ncbi:protein Mmf1p, mitochondrial [Monosporozyma servazzii]
MLRNTLFRSSIFRGLTTLTPVATKNAPPAAASYSQAMKVNNLVFVSGQIPYTSENKPVEGTITQKADQVFQNIKAILEASNSSMDKIVKVNVFLADINYFKEFNGLYAKYFNVHKPARSCVAVKSLPLNVDLEVEVIAAERD